MDKPIKILGEEITREKFPALYQWAKVNPKYLEEVVRQTSEKQNEPVATTLAIMESEYQNDNS